MRYNIRMLSSILPSHVSRYFWGDDLNQLDLSKNSKYIAQTLLERGDVRALKWLFENIDKSSIKALLPKLRLTKKSSYFWKIYLS